MAVKSASLRLQPASDLASIGHQSAPDGKWISRHILTRGDVCGAEAESHAGPLFTMQYCRWIDPSCPESPALPLNRTYVNSFSSAVPSEGF
jgi:hypothetical protein